MLIKFPRFAVLTNPPGRTATPPLAVLIYPAVPRPITVLVKKLVSTFTVTLPSPGVGPVSTILLPP